jgi:AcrR family transcriptional regulator
MEKARSLLINFHHSANCLKHPLPNNSEILLPPKRQHSKNQIEDAAFAIAREQGLQFLSARTVAQKLGCSTSPIYSTFESMQELEDMVCERSVGVMLEYQTQRRTGSPLLDLCLGYILFAVEESQLFRDMFLNKQELSQHSLEMKDFAYRQLLDKMLSKEPALAGLNEPNMVELLEILWTYTHGLAAQINIKAIELPDEQSITNRLNRLIDPLITSLKDS